MFTVNENERKMGERKKVTTKNFYLKFAKKVTHITRTLKKNAKNEIKRKKLLVG